MPLDCELPRPRSIVKWLSLLIALAFPLLMHGLHAAEEPAPLPSEQEPTPAREPEPTPAEGEPTPANWSEPTPAATPADRDASADDTSAGGSVMRDTGKQPTSARRRPVAEETVEEPRPLKVSRDPYRIADPAAELPATPLAPSPRSFTPPSDPIASSKSNTTEDEEPEALPKIEAQALNGITPGVSTANDVDEIWGTAPERKTKDGATHRVYRVEQYKRVDVIIEADKVKSLVIHLERPTDVENVVKDWNLSDVHPVQINDEAGKPLGAAYPERGVLLNFARGATPPRAQQVILETIDAQPFVLRAEGFVYTEPRRSLGDLDQAVKIDPKYSRAHWLRAELLSSIGHIHEALEAATQAAELEPDNADYRLTLGRVAEESGDNARAIKETQAAVDAKGVPDTVKAQALCQLGDMLAAGADYKTALSKHQAAIKIAAALAQDTRNNMRQTGKQILMNAHLAVAHDIAWGQFQQKNKIVPLWIGRGAAHAEEMIQDEGADRELRLRVAERALAACAGAPESLDASEWIKLVSETGKQMVEEADDPWRKRRLQWELGLAMYDALQVVHAHNQFDQALAYGEQAIGYLEQGGRNRQRTPGQDFAIGRLYYRIGSIYAIQKKDHSTAVTWYAKAAPLLEQPLRPAAMSDLGRQGESLVSMGISYWEVGQQDEGLRLTKAGADLMADAVDKGLLKQGALGVPYGNLAGMHHALQHAGEAKSFAALAAQAEGATKEASRPAAAKSR